MSETLSHKMKYVVHLMMVLGLIGCSREQVNSVAEDVSKSYIEKMRDGNIKNWQARVKKTQECESFSVRFKTAGERYSSSANGMYMNDMMKIWNETKSAACDAPV